MAQVATSIPFPHEQRSSRADKRFVPVEGRVSVLEARWEETVPALASKADISNLENRLIKWGVGAGIALLAVFAAVFIANTARMDALDAKLDTSIGKLDARIDRLDAKLDSALAEIKADNRATNARIDRLDEKIDARFDALMAELQSQRRVAQ